MRNATEPPAIDHAAIEHARQLAASAPAPDPETVARLRALLGDPRGEHR